MVVRRVNQRPKRKPDNRPAGSRPFKLPDDVHPDSLAATVARNVHVLMSRSKELQSQMKLAKAAGIGQATVDRILNCVEGTRLDNLEKIAKAFDLMAWQLLLPGLDPANPPVVSLTKTEKELYERLTQIAKQVTEHHVHKAGEATDARTGANADGDSESTTGGAKGSTNVSQ